MTDNVRAAAAAYDAALAKLIGCKGLITPPLTDGKLAMLRERLSEATAQLDRCRKLIDRAEGDTRFIISPFVPQSRRSYAHADPIQIGLMRIVGVSR